MKDSARKTRQEGKQLPGPQGCSKSKRLFLLFQSEALWTKPVRWKTVGEEGDTLCFSCVSPVIQPPSSNRSGDHSSPPVSGQGPDPHIPACSKWQTRRKGQCGVRWTSWHCILLYTWQKHLVKVHAKLIFNPSLKFLKVTTFHPRSNSNFENLVYIMQP